MARAGLTNTLWKLSWAIYGLHFIVCIRRSILWHCSFMWLCFCTNLRVGSMDTSTFFCYVDIISTFWWMWIRNERRVLLLVWWALIVSTNLFWGRSGRYFHLPPPFFFFCFVCFLWCHLFPRACGMGSWYCNDHIRGQGSLEDNRKSSAFLPLGAETCQLSCRKIAGKKGYHSYLNKLSMVGVFSPN